jgi:hypothetical protein
LTLTFTETGGGVRIDGLLDTSFYPNDQWTFDGAKFETRPDIGWWGKTTFYDGLTFKDLWFLWIVADWHGPCPDCPRPEPGENVEGPETDIPYVPPTCYVEIRQQFPETPTTVPEPGGASLMLLGMSALFLFRRVTR